MKLHWPWRRKHQTEGNGHVAAEARQRAEQAVWDQRRLWPAVYEARDELARLAEQAMRGHRP